MIRADGLGECARFRGSLGAVVVWALFAHPVLAQSDAPALFERKARVEAEPVSGNLATERAVDGRQRFARVNHDLLRALRKTVSSGGEGRLRLNLFRDVDYVASIKRSLPTTSGHTLSGPLENVPFGRVVLVANKDVTLGRVFTPDGNYAIRGAGKTLTLEREELRPRHCLTLAPPKPAGALLGGVRATRATRSKSPIAQFGPMHLESTGSVVPGHSADIDRATSSRSIGQTAKDDGGVVDVLVVYPSFVRDLEGGYANMLALIDLDIATANEAFAASGVNLRVQLAAAVEIDYDRFLEGWYETRIGTVDHGFWRDVITHLSGPDDGHMDEVHALRDRHAADLVLLHLGGEVHDAFGDYYVGGIAWAVREVSRENLERLGFSVARSGDGTFVAHELGHSMGLHHDRRDDTDNEPFPYSHGYRFERAADLEDGSRGSADAELQYGTVMSQYSGVGKPDFVLAFSNPELVHPNDPDIRLGVPGDEPSSEPDGPADATRHLNELRETLANVRSRADADACTYKLSGDEGELPHTGGTYDVRVETQAGCEWSAVGGDWVSTESAGTGSGTVRFSVDRNEGFLRRAEVLVAGEVHVRKQTGSRPVTPVCDRSRRIRSFLHENHPDYRFESVSNGTVIIVTHRTRCEDLEFDADYLANIRNFRLPDLSYNGFEGEGLRAGDFDGMSGLFELWLHSMERVPADLFGGLTALRVLQLGEFWSFRNRQPLLNALAPNAFRDLPKLRKLEIFDHRFDSLGSGTFEGLSSLFDLKIRGKIGNDGYTPSTKLAPGSFSGLSSLGRLDFAGHNVGSLGTGVFGDLRNLRGLFLDENGISSVDENTFVGMSSLRVLSLQFNRLSTLPPGVFNALSSLKRLSLWTNSLRRLPTRAFEGLAELEELYLHRNYLRRLEPETFANLGKLRKLNLQNNSLRDLGLGLFQGLETLDELFLRDNELGILRRGVFRGLGGLRELYLTRAGVSSVEPGALEELQRLNLLTLWDNRLWRIEPGVFRGLDLDRLYLGGNAGAPFTFAPTPSLTDRLVATEGQPLVVTIDNVPEAPFNVNVELSAVGGTLSGTYNYVPAGTQRSMQVEVTPDDDRPVTLRVDRTWWRGERYFGQRYDGFRVVPGPPLVLYGFPDVELVAGRGGESFDLASVFNYFLGAAAEYEASSSDATVASVDVEGGTLRLSPESAGNAEVAVTATGPGGETVTRRFTVTVDIPSVPLMLADSGHGREGFVRVINRSETGGAVLITAIDDSGMRHGPVRLQLQPHGAAHFNSSDLQDGNEAKGILEGVGVGKGDWRLEFDSDLDIEALSYVRTGDGFLTAIHDTAPSDEGVHRIVTFNPASNVQQASRLRVVNMGREPAVVTVRGVDDAGASPGSPVQFTVPAGAAREFDAMQLEAGDARLDGALGDGEGKWRLAVESESSIVAMSLLENTSTGHLTNLSSVPPPPDEDGIHHVALFPAAGDTLGRQGFALVINHSNEAGTVRIDAFDDAGTIYGPLELSVEPGAVAHFNSDDLELGASGKGLTGNTGDGEGTWRLQLSSDLDIEVLAYVRSEDGFLTTMHDAVAVRKGRRQVTLFNPGSNTDQVSLLRLVNPLSRSVEVSIVGTDDNGRGRSSSGTPADHCSRRRVADTECVGIGGGRHFGVLRRTVGKRCRRG